MIKFMKLKRLIYMLPLVILMACSQPEVVSEQPSTNPPEWSYNQTIYEVNVRQYSQEGSFDAIRNDLPRLKELGVGILWLMPIHPIGEINRKGTLGSYYSVKDYFDVNPEFGTKEDFRKLVDAVHEQGMYIILDWVANHTAWDNPLTDTNPEFFETDDNGNFIPPRGTDWDDVIQLDFGNPDVWDYMISALVYWVDEFNIDGYRADVADLVPTAFWNRARAELDSVKPVFMLAEAETPEHHYAAFDMSYSWRMHHLFNSIAQGTEPVSKLDEYLTEDRALFPPNAFRMQFTSNHDENSWNGTVFERLGDAVKSFAVLSATIEGMPLLYNGQEAGMSKRLEFFEKDPIDWERNEFFDFYQRLFNLNLTNSALFNGTRGGGMVRIATTADDQIYAFHREKNGDQVVVFLNLSDNPATFSFGKTGLSGTYTELFTDAVASITETDSIDFAPWEYQVWVR